MPAFRPLGERARWRVVYAILCKTATGDVVTYEELGKALELDPDAGRQKIRVAVRQAADVHERDDKRALEAVPNEGYRVVHAPEHLRLAGRFQGKASKALKRGRSKVVNVDLAGMDPDVRHGFEVMAQGFALTADMVQRISSRQEAVEKTLESFVEDKQRDAAEVAELRERQAKLEKELQQMKGD